MKKRDIIIIETLLIVLIYFIVNSKYINMFPKCWIYEKTGLLCLSCGGTRCMQNIASGNWIKAFYCNCAIFVGILYLVILNIVVIYNLGKENKKLTCLYPKWWYIIIFLILWIIYTIFRNLINIGIVI